MDEQKEFTDITELLSDVIGQEYSYVENSEGGSDQHKQAIQNIKTIGELYASIQKNYIDEQAKYDEFNLEKESRMKQLELDEARIAIEREKNEIERDKAQTEQLRYEMDRESRERELKNRERQSMVEVGVSVGTLAISLIGLIAGCKITNKTLDVNLESVMTDRDAVQSGRKIFDHFFR